MNRILVMVVLVAGLFAVMHTVRHGFLDSRPHIDLNVFLQAAKQVEMGLTPYENVGEFGRNYHYPQSWAWVMRSLTGYEREEASRIWHRLSTLFFAGILLVTILWGLRQTNPWPDGAPKRFLAILLSIFLGLGFSAVHYGWRVGQVDLFLILLVAMGLYLPWGRWLPVAAGLFLGIAVVLKLSPIFLVPALGLALGWRFAGAGLCVLAAYFLWLLGMGILPQEIHLYRSQLPFHQYRVGFQSSSLHYFFNVHLWKDHFVDGEGYYRGWLTSLITAVTLAGYTCAGLFLWWKRGGVLSFLTVAVAFSHLSSPFLVPHHYTSTLLLLAPWTILLIRNQDWRGFTLLLLAWIPGGFFLVLYEGMASALPSFMLLLCDFPLIILALTRPGLDGSSSWLLERERVDRWLAGLKRMNPGRDER